MCHEFWEDSTGSSSLIYKTSAYEAVGAGGSISKIVSSYTCGTQGLPDLPLSPHGISSLKPIPVAWASQSSSLGVLIILLWKLVFEEKGNRST